MAVVEELVYELDFEWDKKGFENFNKSLKNSITGFAKLGAAIAATQAVAFSIAKGIADQNDQLAKLAPRLNTTTQEYQKLKFAAQDFGASGDDVTSSLKNLTKAQDDVLRGKGDLEAFGRLGINPADFQNSADLLLAVSDSIQDIQSNSEKITLLERIGVSTNLLQALESGSANIRTLGAEFDALGATVTKKQERIAGEFQANWLRSLTVMNGITNKVGTNLLKSINKFLETFVKLAQGNMKQIAEGFDKFFRAVNKASEFLFFILNRIFTVISGIIGLMGGLENAVIAASAAFVVLKRRMILAFAVPLAVATALFLVIEDIVKGLQGGESFFGDWLDAVNQFPAALEAIDLWFDVLIQKILRIGRDIKEAFSFNSFQLPDFDIPSFGDIGASVGGLFGQSPQAQAVTTIGGDRNASVTINVNGANGDVIDQINTFFQQSSNRIFGE